MTYSTRSQTKLAKNGMSASINFEEFTHFPILLDANDAMMNLTPDDNEEEDTTALDAATVEELNATEKTPPNSMPDDNEEKETTALDAAPVEELNATENRDEIRHMVNMLEQSHAVALAFLKKRLM